MNRLPKDKRDQVLAMLCEGMSMRAVAWVADVSRNTVDKLLQDAGSAALDYQDQVMVNLPCRRVQCDEFWSFIYAREKHVPTAKAAPEWAGDVWTWVAICADTKLVPCWHVGGRDGDHAFEFMADLRPRLANRVQLTTDGHRVYLDAVEGNFGADVDYAMLIKLYGQPPGEDNERRDSPAECIGIDIQRVQGYPDPDHISTSYMERQNLTMRMHMRQFTRLTNAFSKKLENHMHAISLHYLHYNFVRIHKTLKIHPGDGGRGDERGSRH